MKNIEYFIENTKNAAPHDNLKRFIDIEPKSGNAIDLGCGAGRDTIFLIKNNWSVTAIDREDTKNIIEKKLNAEELKRFNFICQNFESVKLNKNDLIVSNFSIPFCSKNYFNEFWTKIVNSINIGRIFCWKFLRIKRLLDNCKTKYGIFN